MHNHQPITPTSLMQALKRQPGAPRCSRCGQQFQLLFSGGRVSEQRCGCGLVYSVESLGTLQFIEPGGALNA